MTVIDLVTGEHVWQMPLGTSRDLAPFPFWWIKGAPNLGGPTVTAAGLIFIAATSDYDLRAFDTETGEQLAKFRLTIGGHATPITYKNKGGRQFAVIAAGGHWVRRRRITSSLLHCPRRPSEQKIKQNSLLANFDPQRDHGVESNKITRSKFVKEVARPAGFEPATHGLEGRCSIQLSYGRRLLS